MTERNLIFVLGIGRSGTSALTRVMSLCGCGLPTALIEGIENEPKGIWEPRDALDMNEKFFRKNVATYFDVSLRLQRETVFDQAVSEEYIKEIQAFLTECPDASMLVLKEPRITAVFPFWLEAARRGGFSVKAVIPFRHPREVIASFAAWDVPEEISSALWLKYILLAERQSRDMARVFVNYSKLLSDWRGEVVRISNRLSINLNTVNGAAVDEFLTGDLYRRRVSMPPAQVFGTCWISRLYELLEAAAEDRAVDVPVFDELYRAYVEGERAFRVLCSGALNTSSIGDSETEDLRERDSARVAQATSGVLFDQHVRAFS